MAVDREYYIPHALDNPMRIIIWTIDEAMVILLPFMIGLWLDWLVSSLFISAIAYTLLRKLKKQHDAYYIVKMIYWYFPPVLYLKKTPHSFRRCFIK